MADITKCFNPERCQVKNYCYRHIAKDSPWQSYASFYKEGEICKNYWEAGKDQVQKK